MPKFVIADPTFRDENNPFRFIFAFHGTHYSRRHFEDAKKWTSEQTALQFLITCESNRTEKPMTPILESRLKKLIMPLKGVEAFYKQLEQKRAAIMKESKDNLEKNPDAGYIIFNPNHKTAPNHYKTGFVRAFDVEDGRYINFSTCLYKEAQRFPTKAEAVTALKKYLVDAGLYVKGRDLSQNIYSYKVIAEHYVAKSTLGGSIRSGAEGLADKEARKLQARKTIVKRAKAVVKQRYWVAYDPFAEKILKSRYVKDFFDATYVCSRFSDARRFDSPEAAFNYLQTCERSAKRKVNKKHLESCVIPSSAFEQRHPQGDVVETEKKPKKRANASAKIDAFNKILVKESDGYYIYTLSEHDTFQHVQPVSDAVYASEQGRLYFATVLVEGKLYSGLTSSDSKNPILKHEVQVQYLNRDDPVLLGECLQTTFTEFFNVGIYEKLLSGNGAVTGCFALPIEREYPKSALLTHVAKVITGVEGTDFDWHAGNDGIMTTSSLIFINSENTFLYIVNVEAYSDILSYTGL